MILVSRAVSLAADSGPLEVRVAANTLNRYGLFFIAGSQKAGIEFASEGFCACRSTASGWAVSYIPYLPALQATYYILRTSLDSAGTLTVSVYSDQEVLLGSRTVNDVAFTRGSIERIGIQAWSTSDYDTDWVRLIVDP